MARNIEIKARIKNIAGLTVKVAELADKGLVEIYQDDTFFACPNGRLKLRTFSATDGELIFYRRPDQSGPKESVYSIVPVAAPDKINEVLSQAYGQSGRVRKHRTLFLIGRTRVHLDRVEGLGDFLELEVVLAENEPAENGVTIAQQLLEMLVIPRDNLIEGAYVDLLKQRGT
jgi:predicted adenylyl cyclase CyaB